MPENQSIYIMINQILNDSSNSQESGLKNILCVCVLLIFCIIAFSGCRMEHESEIDALFEAYSGDAPGAAVMVIRDGRPVVVKGYGLADLDTKTPVSCATNFRLASVSKQFTAMSIMQLVEKGALTFESTLCDIFPGFPTYGHTITLEHLLQHTSGLPSYESLMSEDATEQLHDDDVLRMMSQQDSTYFEPGTVYRYSNSGYAVLAMIVEKLSGRAFPDYLKVNIFQPLGMDNSIAFVDGVNTVPTRAFGYAEDDGSFVFSDQSLTSAVLGDGGIYTSLEDLYLWDQALYTEKLVKRDMMAKAFTSGLLKDGVSSNYGFGWRVDEYNGHKRFWHTGGTCGFSTVIQRYPDERLTVIVLTNRRGVDMKALGESVMELFVDDE